MKHIILAVVVLLASFAATALAQEITGSMVGAVQDASGARISSASVRIQAPEAAVVRSTTTDSNGNFRFTGLPVGKYELQLYRVQSYTPAALVTSQQPSVAVPGAQNTAYVSKIVTVRFNQGGVVSTANLAAG